MIIENELIDNYLRLTALIEKEQKNLLLIMINWIALGLKIGGKK